MELYFEFLISYNIKIVCQIERHDSILRQVCALVTRAVKPIIYLYLHCRVERRHYSYI